MSTTVSAARLVRVLPDDLVNQIAAGEVVERPSSVVKELVENAIDAGATEIEILLEDGGKKLVEVSDNGSGMSESDALTALERHATSKIGSFDDLLSVRTLGFRGEALPSIASVSRFTLVTFDGEAGHGTEIDWIPGMERTVRPAARGRGTTVRVGDLFETVPARRKFLKSADAELRQIVSIVTSYALVAAERSFRLSHNGRVVLDLPAAANVRERVVQILGADIEPSLEPISMSVGSTEATGWVTRGVRFGSRRNQYLFVNGRLVKDRVLTHAISRATDSFDAKGHPGIVLFLTIDPKLVDVNVHPAKTEVRFRDSGQAHVAVELGVRNALGGPEEGAGLMQARETADADFGPVRELSAVEPGQTQSALPPLPASGTVPLYEATPLFRQQPVVQPPRGVAGLEREAPLGDLRGRVIGQYRDSYILVDMPEGLRLIDQHVAHERVLYEKLLKSPSSAIGVQRLLQPVIYETGAAAKGVLESHLEELRAVGFEIEPFSGNSFAISTIPTLMKRESVDRFFEKLLDAAAAERSHVEKLRDKLIATIACHAAIKIHRPMSGTEMSQLVADLLATENPFACPHGRPIIVDIRHLDIEKHFHRK
jgi:DNA mismatch repair protein MutL